MTDTTKAPEFAGTPDIDAATVAVTSSLIAHFESYLQIARWDVNAYRNGFGSDTDGAAQIPVVKGMSETKADAFANLAVRVPKYLQTARAQVGAALWGKLGVNTRAALGDMAYNYGRVPQNVIVAILNNSSSVSDAIRACGKDNHGINQWRRDGEAAVVALDGGQY
jgi:GH24 family phage-related lysozyme (muramidase)